MSGNVWPILCMDGSFEFCVGVAFGLESNLRHKRGSNCARIERQPFAAPLRALQHRTRRGRGLLLRAGTPGEQRPQGTSA
jgi:hypothetical protein